MNQYLQEVKEVLVHQEQNNMITLVDKLQDKNIKIGIDGLSGPISKRISNHNGAWAHKVLNQCINAGYTNIRILDKISRDPIIIHMHSVGGSWNDGMAIFDAIQLAKSYVTIISYGQAESMSSVILQAADKRVMMPNSYFMCHFGSSGYSGNYLDVQKGAAFEKRITELMLDIYTQSCLKGKYFKEQYTEPTFEKVKNYLKRRIVFLKQN